MTASSTVIDLLLIIFRSFYSFADKLVSVLSLPVGDALDTLLGDNVPSWLEAVLNVLPNLIDSLTPSSTPLTMLELLLGMGLLVFFSLTILRWAIGFIPL